MTATHQTWTDDPRYYGAGYFGPPAPAFCCAVTDDEEPNPAFFIDRSNMPNDDNETTETLAPPTDHEAKTNPENEAPEPRHAIVPEAMGKRGNSYFEEAARDFAASLVEMRGTRKDIADGFAKQGGKLDEMTREFAANYSLLSGEFKSFRGVVEARLEDGERRFDAIEARLDDLKKEQIAAAERQLEAARQIASLETELRLLKANAPRPAQAAPTAT